MAKIPDIRDFPDPAHVHTLTSVISSTVETGKMIEKMKAAGLDMSGPEEQNNMHRKVAEELKRQFYPNHS